MQEEGRLDGGSEHVVESQAGSGRSVVVRRNAALAALIGGAASAIAIAYLWRATESGAVLDWVLCGVLTAMAGYYLATLLDARTPLVVADDLGVRIRLGRQWRGLPWGAVAAVEIQPRRSPIHDGRLVFRPHSLARALDGLESGGRRAARLNQRMYGGALAVPMGLTTRSSADPEGLRADLEDLSGGRIDVTLVLARPDPAVEPGPEVESSIEPERQPDQPARREPRRTFIGGLATVVSRVAKGRSHDTDTDTDIETDADPDAGGHNAPDDDPGVGPTEPLAPAALAAPLRTVRPGSRAQIIRDLPATSLGSSLGSSLGNLGAAALRVDPAEHSRHGPGLPERRELRRPGSVDLVFEPVARGSGSVRPIARLGEPVEPLVIDGFVTEPAYDPVIGPQLSAARTRVGLSVDELANRTRIRPHVIEAIEVDDFAPCGGDFYARGHLRTLARVLGQDAGALLASFDNRYATAPINARRVFEAELATGTTRGIRSTVGGPHWGLLIGTVLCLVMAWGAIRLFETDPQQLVPGPTPVLNGSAGVDRRPQTAPDAKPKAPLLPVTLVANEAATRVVVRDGAGAVVYAGPLVLGERKSLRVDPPLRVRAVNAGAVTVRVRGQERGPVGELGTPGTRTYIRPAPR
ncbi:MAG: helix-turn-helix domain-containing protein [Nocardioides sp.]